MWPNSHEITMKCKASWRRQGGKSVGIHLHGVVQGLKRQPVVAPNDWGLRLGSRMVITSRNRQQPTQTLRGCTQTPMGC
eukprot:scaffold210267_cov19-Prasinocladus_malaysianus.AAC.1